jgi:hypothetical protein
MPAKVKPIPDGQRAATPYLSASNAAEMSGQSWDISIGIEEVSPAENAETFQRTCQPWLRFIQ